MLINFNEEDEIKVSGMNGGVGTLYAKMHIGESGKIIPSRLTPGSSIGYHPHPTSDDINYVISGVGKAVCDGVDEPLAPGICHICKKDSSHSIINTGTEDLVLLTVVVER